MKPQFNKPINPGLNDNSGHSTFMENYQIYGSNNPSFNGSRAFGREITNYLSNAQTSYSSLMDPQKKQIGRSLSMNMSKGSSVTQFLKKQNLMMEEMKSNEALTGRGHRSFVSTNHIPDRSKMMIEEDEASNFGLARLERIDAEKQHLPSYVSLYAKDIFEYLKNTEVGFKPEGGYVGRVQTDINEKMRAILVDWLVDVHLKFKLLPETLFLTVNYIDRYLDKVLVSRKQLQLVGVAAMLIACKYEEIYAPEVKDFVFVTDKAYTKEEILDMESRIISSLEFKLTTTSPNRFLERFLLINESAKDIACLSKYLIELSLVEYKMMKYMPSLLAASAVYLSNKIFKKHQAWSECLLENTGYAELDLRTCAKDLCLLMQNADKSNLNAVKRKFATQQNCSVSKIQLEKT